MSLKNKVALITGAGSGIGRATAILFAKEGARVVVADSDDDWGDETARIVRENGGEAAFVHADVSRANEVRKMVERTVELYGRLDVLHNNAGVMNVSGTVVETSEETWNRVIDVNLKGVFLGMKYAIPQMIKQGGGSIINTASALGLVGWPRHSAYDASKGGVVNLTRSSALDFGSKNVRINCICPGSVDTPPVQKRIRESSNPSETLKELERKNAAIFRLISADEVANVALFLASDVSSGVTGAFYTVDGGWTAE